MSNCISCGGSFSCCGGSRRCSCGSNETLNRRLAVIKTQLDTQKIKYSTEDILKYMIENNRSNNEEVQEHFGRTNPNPITVQKEKYTNLKCEYEIDMPGSKCIYCSSPKRRRDKYASDSQCIVKR